MPPRNLVLSDGTRMEIETVEFFYRIVMVLLGIYLFEEARPENVTSRVVHRWIRACRRPQPSVGGVGQDQACFNESHRAFGMHQA